MPSGVFNQWGPPDKAKKLKIDGKWIWPDKRCNLDGIEPGMRVEFEMIYGGSDGKLPILTKIWPQTNGNGHAQMEAAVEVSPLDGEGMRFISNVLGSGLRGGVIKAPHELTQWTQAAYRAFKSIGAGEPGLNDDLGREPGSDDDSEDPSRGMPSNW